MELKRIFDLLPRYENEFVPKDDCLAGKVNKEWVKYSLKDFRNYADIISSALINIGIKKGDKIATISSNRPEWNFVDFGVLQIGAVHVPIYPTISEQDYKYILNHSEVKVLFVEDAFLYKKIKHILNQLSQDIIVFSFTKVEGIKQFDELLDNGKPEAHKIQLDDIKASIDEDDIATLIYTSGTTGNPKGVMLTHKNILSNVLSLFHIFPVDQTSKCLSYLPLCHVYERTNIYIYLYLGVSIYYAESMATIGDNLKEISPEILTTVPRLLEKVFDKIIGKGRKLNGIAKQLFFWAVRLGEKYEYDDRSLLYDLRLKIADKLIFVKWREALGGNMRAVISGGAAIQPRLARVFNAAGIPLIEGYGMTETSPVIAVNTFEPGQRKVGTVGPPIKCNQVKISERGEILVKGDNVMKGYFKDPEMTKEAIVDGWMHTGDQGIIDDDGMLKITGRVKEIFKTSMGKYISPVLLENKIKESPFVDQIMVIGENQKFAAALIVPAFEHLRSWCKIKEIEYTTNAEMIKDKLIINRYKREINCFNKDFGDTEKIKRFELIDHEWTIDSGEITPNLKLKRKSIQDKYDGLINKIFGI
ncbi:MAG: long-chain fatty acid--CoA ligase [Marinilabiliales bacterium]|nr:MAG: long-chain fatty acid--CoA ligase [Marinilabiliales bacterium]